MYQTPYQNFTINIIYEQFTSLISTHQSISEIPGITGKEINVYLNLIRLLLLIIIKLSLGLRLIVSIDQLSSFINIYLALDMFSCCLFFASLPLTDVFVKIEYHLVLVRVCHNVKFNFYILFLISNNERISFNPIFTRSSISL